MGNPETFFEEAHALKEEILAPILADYKPRVKLGRFSWPWPDVIWYSAPETGTAYTYLSDSAMRWSGRVLFEPSYVSHLALDEGGDNGITTAYDFDFNNSRMRKSLTSLETQPKSWLTEYRELTRTTREESRYGLDESTEADYAVVIEELKRGASGLYHIERGMSLDDEN